MTSGSESGATGLVKLPLGSGAWIEVFNAASGPDSTVNEPGAAGTVAVRGAPHSAQATMFRVACDEEGRMLVETLPAGSGVDLAVEWADIVGLSGLTVPEAIGRASVIRPKVYSAPSEDSLRLVWKRFAGYATSTARVPDFTAFTLAS